MFRVLLSYGEVSVYRTKTLRNDFFFLFWGGGGGWVGKLIMEVNVLSKIEGVSLAIRKRNSIQIKIIPNQGCLIFSWNFSINQNLYAPTNTYIYTDHTYTKHLMKRILRWNTLIAGFVWDQIGQTVSQATPSKRKSLIQAQLRERVGCTYTFSRKVKSKLFVRLQLKHYNKSILSTYSNLFRRLLDTRKQQWWCRWRETKTHKEERNNWTVEE